MQADALIHRDRQQPGFTYMTQNSRFEQRWSSALRFRNGGLLHVFEKEEHCSMVSKRWTALCFRKGGALLHDFPKEEQRSIFSKSRSAPCL
jgi:hypothetical protein